MRLAGDGTTSLITILDKYGEVLNLPSCCQIQIYKNENANLYSDQVDTDCFHAQEEEGLCTDSCKICFL